MSKLKIQMALILLIALICTPLFGNAAKAFGPVAVWSGSSAQSASYARALQLQYNGSNNGKMYATFETWTGNVPGPSFPIFESTNGGQSWSQVGTVTDVNAGAGEYLREQGFLYELPQQVGSMPAGTMLLAVNSFPDGEQVHNLQLYKSNDLGRSWTYVSTIASGGAYGGGMNWQSQGIWEPFLLVANNKLICYYADEQSPDHNQMVVHRTSTDGVNWSGTVNDVTLGELRPGMPVVTKMGNGQYMLVYEIVGLPHDQVHFKISSNPENWGKPDRSGN
ncbi:sialidase family protein [Cohnella rhizosphaerae]|uniref:Exo-alpha-sialidase n=1 Tax=Cohnella rhizosphaerae TaxID=1457232 RepID=A0A9X4L4S0_9BACL|nr:hypothetical protein [Cohnella rhizosphaerae]MDG0813457.1 hypothetical protein [Cohnella rhizosphaerae]